MTMKQYLLLTTQYGGYTTYGIGYVEYDGDRPILIETYPDLCHIALPVERLVESCNRSQLDHYHLRDVIEDFLGSF